MNRAYFSKLTGYTVWVNQQVITWLQELTEEQWERPIPSSFSSIRQTTVHIVSAERIWTDFWQEHSEPVFLSTEFLGSKQDLITIWKEVSARLQVLMDGYPEEKYNQAVRFSWRGREWQMDFWQTFSHFVNHATYHRGQLVTQMRQAGFTDFSSTDFATYCQQMR